MKKLSLKARVKMFAIFMDSNISEWEETVQDLKEYEKHSLITAEAKLREAKLIREEFNHLVERK